MSLLMDALRRAEQEKKVQADSSSGTDSEHLEQAGVSVTDHSDSTAEGDEDTRVSSRRLDTPVSPLPAPTVERGNAPGGESPSDLPAAVDDGDFTYFGDLSEEFSLSSEFESLKATSEANSDVTSFSSDLALEPLAPEVGADDSEHDEQASAAGALENTDTDDAEPVSPPGDVTGSTTTGARPRDEQTQTIPSTRALESDLNAYFDHSQSIEIPRSVQTGDLTLEDVAAHTVVGAQTVFAAGERPRSRRVFIVVAVLALVIVLGIGVVGLFYAQQSSEPYYLPSPTVADGVERPRLRELPVVPLDPPVREVHPQLARIETQTEIATATPDGNAPVTGVIGEGRLAGLSDTIAEAGQAIPEVPAASAQSNPTTAQNAVAAIADSNAAPLETPPSAAVTAPTLSGASSSRAPASTAALGHERTPPVPANDGVGAGELRIARTIKPATVDHDVEQAYAAYQSGQLERAADLYARALKRRPQLRDAQLGLAAVALAQGDIERAYGQYQAVLAAHPGDSIATAALLGIGNSQDDSTAARLRLMLDQHGDEPYIHFALGNWYAQQARWGDAQQAYFDAFRLDGNNPHYAYNLAVSLDQMGQAAAALEYYQKSLSLADKVPGYINSAAVLERIQALSTTAAR